MPEPRPHKPLEPPPSAPNRGETSQPPSPSEQQTEHIWTVDEEGVVIEPGDHADPSFDDDLDPTDAP